MNHFQLKPSCNLLYLNIALYLLAATSLIVYYPVDFVSLMLLLLIILLLAWEFLQHRQKTRQGFETLSLHLSSQTIDWCSNDHSRSFTEHSLYSCRWGMILILKQPKYRKHIILLPDRFENIDEYLDLRYQLIRLNRARQQAD